MEVTLVTCNDLVVRNINLQFVATSAGIKIMQFDRMVFSVTWEQLNQARKTFSKTEEE